MPPKKKISPKQSLFVNNLLKGMTQEEAYIKAGYSPKASRACASRMLTKANIKKEYNTRKEKANKEADVTREKIIKEYARIAFVDIRKLFKKNGSLKAIHDLDDDTAAALGGVDIQEGVLELVTKKFKLIDKRGALDSLAKIEGLFEKDNEQKAKLDIDMSPALTDMFDKTYKGEEK